MFLACYLMQHLEEVLPPVACQVDGGFAFESVEVTEKVDNLSLAGYYSLTHIPEAAGHSYSSLNLLSKSFKVVLKKGK